MTPIDLSSLPDPTTTPPVSDADADRARNIIAAVPSFFDIPPEYRGKAQDRIADAVRLDPHNTDGWFNLGVYTKLSQQWQASALCNVRATQIADFPEGSPEYWNLGIAATALHDWSTARYAWAKFGLPIAEGSDEVREDYGIAPVRIFSPNDSAEVVWGWRICPARVQVTNVPWPASGHRWHDIVLHDGAPNGYRTWGGQDYPVFDELERWSRSDVATLECLVQGEEGDIVELLQEFPEGTGAEDWTKSVRSLCRQCSEGHPDAGHKHGNFLASDDGRIIGIAAARDVAEQILDSWVAHGNGRSRSEVFDAEAASGSSPAP